MFEVLTVRPDLTEAEIDAFRVRVYINPPIGIIVTRPKDMKLADAIGADIMTMFNHDYDQALEAANQIAKTSDSLIVVIGEANVAANR